MSRRTKLILLLLVLLGIPALYIVFTWAPHAPLRFHIVENHTPTSAAYFTSLGLVIENTSPAPICLYKADMTRSEMKQEHDDPAHRVGILHPMDYPAKLMAHGHSIMVIPPHGTIQTTALVEHASIPDAKAGRLHLHYDWMSRTRFTVSSFRRWVHLRAPQWFRSMLPEFSENRDSAPLETTARS